MRSTLSCRMVQVLPNGPLLDYKWAFGEQELKAPNAAGTLGLFELFECWRCAPRSAPHELHVP